MFYEVSDILGMHLKFRDLRRSLVAPFFNTLESLTEEEVPGERLKWTRGVLISS
ncbi:hypothetical protein NB231_05075 [Nitrococcus mobilis Nb-231]|uniref:Uncharacterized protein n=1 Tax=Nitrococcus mobilis Nb-231 TaxID=314278 RepID=A4BQ99_9GAMM|nr:hypothetical protein NB231_05075 [Nitrococcus mobilis Nb-231]